MNRQNGILSQYYFHHPSFRYPAGISISVDPHKSSLTSLGLHHSAPGIAAFVALGSPLEVAGDPGRSCAGSQDDLKLGPLFCESFTGVDKLSSFLRSLTNIDSMAAM